VGGRSCPLSLDELMRSASENDFLDLGATEIAAALRRGEVSSADLVDGYLDRIEIDDDRLRAFIHVDPDAVRAAAEAADRRRADTDDPPALLGLPIAIKDNLAVAGAPTTGGTKLLADYVPGRDAGVVAALRDAGAIVLGKTNMHEAAFGITCKNPHYGFVKNPHDEERIAGGSSGGTAVAVAAGLSPAGLGSDTGGSVRVPAALCGLVGVRPSTSMVPRDGLMSLSWTCDSIGPITRTVADARLLLEAISRQTLGGDGSGRGLEGVRLGVLGGSFGEADRGTAEAFAAFCARLVDAGATIEEVDVAGAEDAMARLFDVVLPESWVQLRELVGAAIPGADLRDRMAELGDDVRAAIAGEAGIDGERVSAERYLRTLRDARPALQAAAAAAFEGLDALLSPTTPTPAVRFEEEPEMDFAGTRVPTFQTFISNCCLASFADLPAISLPIGSNSSGLPIGAQLIGAADAMSGLLDLASACEGLVARA
jgi:Asp-tRNA(Asn)/Glu-tRNA(Gln) amidotransferase A subunit family amidase